MIISGPQIYSANGILKNAALLIHENKIHAIEQEKKSHSKNTLKFPENYHLVPGFIDLHIHGANGSDVMDGNFSSLETISKALAAAGTTAFLATTMTASPEQIDAALLNVAAFVKKQHEI